MVIFVIVKKKKVKAVWNICPTTTVFFGVAAKCNVTIIKIVFDD